MIKLMRILPLLFIIGAGGLFTYQKINTKTTVANWIGEYEISKVNLAERKYLFKKYNLKEDMENLILVWKVFLGMWLTTYYLTDRN